MNLSPPFGSDAYLTPAAAVSEPGSRAVLGQKRSPLTAPSLVPSDPLQPVAGPAPQPGRPEPEGTGDRGPSAPRAPSLTSLHAGGS